MLCWAIMSSTSGSASASATTSSCSMTHRLGSQSIRSAKEQLCTHVRAVDACADSPLLMTCHSAQQGVVALHHIITSYSACCSLSICRGLHLWIQAGPLQGIWTFGPSSSCLLLEMNRSWGPICSSGLIDNLQSCPAQSIILGTDVIFAPTVTVVHSQQLGRQRCLSIIALILSQQLYRDLSQSCCMGLVLPTDKVICLLVCVLPQ